MVKTFDINPRTSHDAKKVQDLLAFNEVVRVRTAVTAVTAVTLELPRWANEFASLVLSHPLVVRERKAIKLYHATKLLAWGKLLHDELGRDNVISKSFFFFSGARRSWRSWGGSCRGSDAFRRKNCAIVAGRGASQLVG